MYRSAHSHPDVGGGPAALIAAASIARGVVDLRSKDVLAGRSKRGGRRGFDDLFGIAARTKRNSIAREGDLTRRAMLAPVHRDVRRLGARGPVASPASAATANHGAADNRDRIALSAGLRTNRREFFGRINDERRRIRRPDSKRDRLPDRASERLRETERGPDE